jgi:hypothetical protein
MSKHSPTKPVHSYVCSQFAIMRKYQSVTIWEKNCDHLRTFFRCIQSDWGVDTVDARTHARPTCAPSSTTPPRPENLPRIRCELDNIANNTALVMAWAKVRVSPTGTRKNSHGIPSKILARHAYRRRNAIPPGQCIQHHHAALSSKTCSIPQPSEVEALYRKEGACHRHTQPACDDDHLATASWDGSVDVDV